LTDDLSPPAPQSVGPPLMQPRDLFARLINGEITIAEYKKLLAAYKMQVWDMDTTKT